MKRWVLIFLITVNLSCSNKIDIIGEYEEMAVVYALLDPSQSVQYIKINRTFTNPGTSAANVAQIADSLYFDSLTPVLIEQETGRIIKLFKANVLLKDNGFFASSPNYLYVTKGNILPNKRQIYYHYRFEMMLPKSQKLVSATTNIPDSLRLSKPLNIISQIHPAIDIPTDGNLKLEFRSTANTKIIDAYFFFNYLEVNKLDTNVKTAKTFKWRMVNGFRTDTDIGGEFVNVFASCSSFYEQLLNQTPIDTTIKRKILPCRIEFTVGNIELDNFIQASAPSIGIVQKQIEYTNVNNGHGIFASKCVSRYNNLIFEPYYITALPKFKKWGFVR